MIEFQQHLFNRREVVALILDLDDESLGLTDMALPPLPIVVPTSPANNNNSSSNTPTLASSYVPPQTRLDVAREALAAFVSIKLRSAPNSSFMTFALYAVRHAGRTEADVVELVAPTATGAAGVRAVQAALKELSVGTYSYGAPEVHDRTPKDTNKSGTDGSSGGAVEGAPYSGVLRRLRSIYDAATALHSQQQQQQQQGSLTIADSTDASPGQRVNGGVESPSGNGCVVVHGIAVRSRVGTTSPLFPLPSALEAEKREKAALSANDAISTVWLDVLSMNALPASSPSLQHGPAAAATKPSTTSVEATVENVHCALLDPVELTGVKHRGLALGPALVRVMSVPEPRTQGFVQRPLTMLKILRTNTTTTTSGAAVASSEHAIASASSEKSALSNNTPNTSGMAGNAATGTRRQSKTQQQQQQPLHDGRNSTPAKGLTSSEGLSPSMPVPTRPTAPSNSRSTAAAAAAADNGRTALPQLSSGSASQRGGGFGADGPRLPNSSSAAATATGTATTAGGGGGSMSSSATTKSGTPLTEKRGSVTGAAGGGYAALPAVSQRKNSSSTASQQPQRQQQQQPSVSSPHFKTRPPVIRKEKDASRASTRNSSFGEDLSAENNTNTNNNNNHHHPPTAVAGNSNKVATRGEVSGFATSTSSGAHRYSTDSPDTNTTTTTTSVNSDRNALSSSPMAGKRLSAQQPPPLPSQRSPAAGLRGSAGPTPSLGGRSPENSPGARRPPPQQQQQQQLQHRPQQPPLPAAKGSGVAATLQAPLSAAAVRQQQQQQQQTVSTSLQEASPHRPLHPQPPIETGRGNSPLAHRYAEAAGPPPSSAHMAVNPRQTTGAVSAGSQRKSPSPTGTSGRRVSAGAPMSHLPPSTTGSVIAVRNLPRVQPQPQSADTQSWTM